MRTIGVIACARSDYGIYLPILKRLGSHPDLRPHIYATGMHLSPEFGLTVSQFAKDGLEVHDRVEMLLSSDTPEGIAKSMGLGAIGFAQVYSRWRPDILLVMGDRFEMHAATVAALPYKIPIAHIHGGEVTEGAMDESIRHAITKMSHLHFPAVEAYARRIRQMGEEDWRITVCGAPGLDNIGDLPLLNRQEAGKKYGFDPAKPVLLVTFHPVTLEYENTEMYVSWLLDALGEVDIQVLFTYPNADTAGRVVIEKIKAFCGTHGRASIVMNAGQPGYLSLLNCVDGMVGNSSSGIIEAASFKLPVVDIGTRQRGRIRGINVVGCGYSKVEIAGAIRTILEPGFRTALHDLTNPYGDGRASERIISRLAEVDIDQRLLSKKFVDRSID